MQLVHWSRCSRTLVPAIFMFHTHSPSRIEQNPFRIAMLTVVCTAKCSAWTSNDIFWLQGNMKWSSCMHLCRWQLLFCLSPCCPLPFPASIIMLGGRRTMEFKRCDNFCVILMQTFRKLKGVNWHGDVLIWYRRSRPTAPKTSSQHNTVR